VATFDLKTYAMRGAEARLVDLREEMEGIHRAFPDLRKGRVGRPGRTKAVVNHEEQATGATRARRRWKMSPAQKRAVGLRMKAYWAARKAAAGAKKR
jgi:hypothetical protein